MPSRELMVLSCCGYMIERAGPMETDSISVTFSSSHWDMETSLQLAPLAVVRSALPLVSRGLHTEYSPV